MSTAVRVLLAVSAAAATLAIGRAVAAREENHRMTLPMSLGVGVALLAVYLTIALSV
ncbi:hypothetical protein [Phycicoccus sp. Soil802]|uniref:hypothetical protein n=1 Tax=Phycicoccus sp. Soil802 TaxID=1736414 RepID=UPI000AD653D4|nr:hypothetical protein [Phycicoccus sp. Soil802]